MKLSLVLILLLACTACIQLGGEAQPQHFYLLAPRVEVADANPAPLNLLLGRIEFPSYLDRLQLVTRTPQNELVIADNDRWGEPLQDNLVRVLKENLQRQLSGLRISSYPWQPATKNGLLLKLTVNQFDGTLGRQTNVDIRWILSEITSKQVLVQKHFVDHQPIGDTSADLVTGLSQALAQLSTQIAAELQQVK